MIAPRRLLLLRVLLIINLSLIYRNLGTVVINQAKCSRVYELGTICTDFSFIHTFLSLLLVGIP